MIYDFETLVSRKNTGSGKWDEMTKEHPNLPENVAPLSVADMELKNPPEIVEGLKKYTALAHDKLSCRIDELAGLNVSRAALNAGKAGKALPKGLGIHKGLNVVIQHIGNELVRLNVHFVERRAGCGTFAALHALVGVDAADLADLLRLFADAHFNASSFTPRASARSSVK